jgi:hypothetical protein
MGATLAPEKTNALALRLFASYGSLVSSDRKLAALLESYRLAIRNTWASMEREKVTEACAACAARAPGSCCFYGVEEWYDPILLLINLLLEVQLPISREVPESCLFLGPRGCKLLARHSFCVNYLCPDLKALIRAVPMRRLGAIIGEELSCGWELERALHEFLRRNGFRGL